MSSAYLVVVLAVVGTPVFSGCLIHRGMLLWLRRKAGLRTEQPLMDTLLIIFLTLIGASCLTIALISFIEKRKSLKPQCCHGRPGLPVPVNLLDNYRNRIGYALSFGATIFSFVGLFRSSNHGYIGYIGGLVVIEKTCIVGILTYPLFICQTTKHQIAGSTLGFLYSCLWLAMDSFAIYEQINNGTLQVTAVSLLIIPEMFCVAALNLKFIIALFMNIMKKSWRDVGKSQGDQEDDTKGYMMFYVRSLLQRSEQQQEQEYENTFDMMRAWLYPSRPEFKYPTTIVVVFFVSYISVLILSVTFFFEWSYLGILDSKHLLAMKGCWYSAICVATLRSCVVLFNMMCLYRSHVTKLRRGDRSWLPEYLRHRDPSPTSATMSSMMYAGLQIGYVTWGWLTSFLLILLIFLAIAFLTFKNNYSTWMLGLFLEYWPIPLLMLVTYVMQFIAVKYFFLMEKGNVMIMDNRRAYHIFTYLLLFYNIFFGFLAGFWRLIEGEIIGIIFREQLQKSILPTTFERFDRGYKAYVGYVIVENAYANPVMRCFVYILQQTTLRSRIYPTNSSFLGSEFNSNPTNARDDIRIEVDVQPPQCTQELLPSTQEALTAWKRARNRWQLAYTMLRNPSLVQYRKWRLNPED